MIVTLTVGLLGGARERLAQIVISHGSDGFQSANPPTD
jgi:hypothetical protein